jgi:pimeloyl-ACP methyl ester carboxylesterase
VPLQTQGQDALAALRMLREAIGPVPVGLWGYSQGAWAAALAVTMQPDLVQFLVCVSCSGVSPAVQMRVGCANQLQARIRRARGHRTHCDAAGLRALPAHG